VTDFDNFWIYKNETFSIFLGDDLSSGKQAVKADPVRPRSGDQMDQGFNIEDILHMDVIPGKCFRFRSSIL